MKREIKKIKLDGQEAYKLKCPKCGEWCYLDDDQFNGRVSTFHDIPECGYHETVDFSKEDID